MASILFFGFKTDFRVISPYKELIEAWRKSYAR